MAASNKVSNVKVIKHLRLRGWMWGMTWYSNNSVAIAYAGDPNGIDIIDSAGKTKQYEAVPSITDRICFDLVFQQDGSLCVHTGDLEAHLYYPNGKSKSTISLKKSHAAMMLSRSPSDEILIATRGKQVYIYDPTGSTLKHTVPTKHNDTSQVSATRSDLIVASSCECRQINSLAVYDRDGNAGEPLEAPSDHVDLFATVDEEDRVYVASRDRKNSNVVIRLYDLDGLNLKERVEFNELNKLNLESTWCYFVSLSPDLLAFACKKELYFIKVTTPMGL